MFLLCFKLTAGRSSLVPKWVKLYLKSKLFFTKVWRIYWFRSILQTSLLHSLCSLPAIYSASNSESVPSLVKHVSSLQKSTGMCVYMYRGRGSRRRRRTWAPPGRRRSGTCWAPRTRPARRTPAGRSLQHTAPVPNYLHYTYLCIVCALSLQTLTNCCL